MVNQCLEFAGWHPSLRASKDLPVVQPPGWQTLGFVQHAVARQFQVLARSQQALRQECKQLG